MSATGWDEDYRRLRTRSLSVRDLRGDDGHLVYLCSPLERAVLQRLHKDLIWMLPGQDLAPHLYSKGLITPFEQEQFQAKTTLSEKNEHLLMSLSRRPAGVLEKLLSCLDGNNEIPGVKVIAKALRQKWEDVKLELSQAGSVAPLQTEAQTEQASPGQMVPLVVFEYIRDENKRLKKESEMLRQRATMLEEKLECIKERVQMKLREAFDNDSHSRQVTDNVKSQTNNLKLPLQESKTDAYDEDRVATPTGDDVQHPHSNQIGRIGNLQRYYSMQDLSYPTSDHGYTEQQTQYHVQKRYDMPLQQIASMSVDPGVFYIPSPPQNGDDEQDDEQDDGGSTLENIPYYFKSDNATTPVRATDSVGKLSPERRSSPRHTDSVVTSPKSTTPEKKKTDISKIKTVPGGSGSSQHMPSPKETPVDKPSAQKTREELQPYSKSGAEIPKKPLPPVPPKSEAGKSKAAQNKKAGHTSPTPSRSGKSRSRSQLKYDQLNNPQPDETADTTAPPAADTTAPKTKKWGWPFGSSK